MTRVALGFLVRVAPCTLKIQKDAAEQTVAGPHDPTRSVSMDLDHSVRDQRRMNSHLGAPLEHTPIGRRRRFMSMTQGVRLPLQLAGDKFCSVASGKRARADAVDAHAPPASTCDDLIAPRLRRFRSTAAISVACHHRINRSVCLGEETIVSSRPRTPKATPRTHIVIRHTDGRSRPFFRV